MVATETKRVCEGVLVPFCYKFVVQILSVQIFNFSVEILLIKLLSKKVSIQHTKRLKDIFSCMVTFTSITFMKQSKTIETISKLRGTRTLKK